MVLYYAIGGGLGHLTRACAVWNTLKINLSEVLLLTASTHAHESYIPANVRVCKVEVHFQQKENQQIYQDFLKRILIENKISAIYLDAFPLGIIKEWHFLGDFLKENNLSVKIYYLARLLNDNYFEDILQDNTTNLAYNTVFLLENLTSKNTDFIEKNAQNIEKLTLIYPNFSRNKQINKLSANFMVNLTDLPENYWLIVHSEPLKEIEILLDFARKIAKKDNKKPFFVVACALGMPDNLSENYQKNQLFDDKNILWINYYPASDLFENAEKIFSGAGFNIIQQVKKYHKKLYLMPFKRKLDLQELRAKQYANIHTATHL